MISGEPHTFAEIDKKILTIRGERVMLDSDLAEIYGVETKVLNQAVKRNVDRFPDDFMFRLTDMEFEELTMRSQFVTASKRNIRHRPFAFTEHGAVMLASILKSEVAIKASVQVVRAFLKMRSLLQIHQDLADRIESLEKTSGKHDQNFAVVSELLKTILNDPKSSTRRIGFIEDGST